METLWKYVFVKQISFFGKKKVAPLEVSKTHCPQRFSLAS